MSIDIWPETNREFVSGIQAPDVIDKAWFFPFAVNEMLLRFNDDGNYDDSDSNNSKKFSNKEIQNLILQKPKFL